MINRTHSRTTKWNVIFRYMSIFMTVVQGLLLVPLYLSYIPVEIYGAWLASGNILAWISAIDPGLTIVLQQQTSTFYGAGELKKVGKLIGSGLILSCLILMIALFLGLISSYFIINLLNLSLDVDNSLILKAFKYAFLGAGEFSWFWLGYSFVFMLILLFMGIIIFNRVEKSFMDTV